MNKPDNPSTDPTSSGCPVPFNKPSTLPGGWDLSSQPSRQYANLPANKSDPLEEDAVEDDYLYLENNLGQAQKFTQPRTIPKGWDTSALK